MIGNAAGQVNVGAGGQVEVTAASALLAQKLEKGVAVGQVRRIQGDGLCDECLERSLAFEQMTGQAEG